VRRNQASAVATKQNNFPIAKLFVRCSTVNAKIARIAQNTAQVKARICWKSAVGMGCLIG
jgi:hypothetical protein